MSHYQSQRFTFTIRLSGILAMALAVVWSATAQAQSAPTPEWTQTSLTGPVKRLYTPASGALFARTNDGLVRSDDGGTRWLAVSLPVAAPVPGMPAGWTRAIVVDPTNHAIIYA